MQTARDEGGRLVVAFVVEGSPAQRAGVRPGAAILRINGQPVAASYKKECASRTDPIVGMMPRQ